MPRPALVRATILSLQYPIFGFHHPPSTLHHKLFFVLLRGLDMSDEPRMGWYDSRQTTGGTSGSTLKSQMDLEWVGMTQV